MLFILRQEEGMGGCDGSGRAHVRPSARLKNIESQGIKAQRRLGISLENSYFIDVIQDRDPDFKGLIFRLVL